MIGIDTNILVYAHRAECVEHSKAKEILNNLCMGDNLWAVAWPSLYEFLRVVTHPKVFSPPSQLSIALNAIGSIVECPSVRVLGPGVDHWRWMQKLVKEANATANVAFDAFIAAVFMDHGIREVLTNDGDFRRFKGLTVVNPFE